MNEEIIFKWNKEWDRESIGSVFEKPKKKKKPQEIKSYISHE